MAFSGSSGAGVGDVRALRFERLGPAELGRAATVSERDVYVDTADGRLAAAHWACRLRQRNGETLISLKGPPEPTEDDWHHRRPEVEGPASASLDPATWPASAARDRLGAMTGGATLSERFALDQRRTERDVRVGDATVGTLSLDAVRVLVEGRERADPPSLVQRFTLADRWASRQAVLGMAYLNRSLAGVSPGRGLGLGLRLRRRAMRYDLRVPAIEITEETRETLAEYARTTADLLVPKPATLTFEQAAAVPMGAVTALRGIRTVGQAQAGQRVLVNGAAGGVGTFAVQIAAALGAEVTGVCSARNVSALESSGPW